MKIKNKKITPFFLSFTLIGILTFCLTLYTATIVYDAHIKHNNIFNPIHQQIEEANFTVKPIEINHITFTFKLNTLEELLSEAHKQNKPVIYSSSKYGYLVMDPTISTIWYYNDFTQDQPFISLIIFITMTGICLSLAIIENKYMRQNKNEQ